ncbi:hypothetical protein [Polyangium jinanense]|uniref:Right-handed parallel beta-helix repeat-containing protein n=1 Tax=Polyangium jinanense TaxID=2829994 RepID=A0A9X3WYU2_9BACT|nr:hypothetical protein [Polyangium jinanense]MDC3954496.1 right-handed parallel beta-helix repeat-containing protein [Polyangium jinanense]MDC3980799.1 right-handed parallel beta-helix repeat-containing protein [Polyangium jinanense]
MKKDLLLALVLSLIGCGTSSDPMTPIDGGVGDAETGGDAGGDAGDPCWANQPGPDNTGVPKGTILTPSGSIQVTTNGAIVEDLDIQGEVQILADDVTIRRCRITSGDYYPIRYFDNDNKGLVVEDTEIIGTSADVTAGLSFSNYTARRVNVHGSADGFKADENVLIEDSWIHDLGNYPDQHNDGVQSTHGLNVHLRHNRIEGASNACVQTGDESGDTTDLLIECNWLSGGGYSLNLRGKMPTGIKVLRNRFKGDWGYGPWTIDDPNPTVVGNVNDADGTPIEYP